MTTGSPLARDALSTALPSAWYSGVVTSVVPASGIRTSDPQPAITVDRAPDRSGELGPVHALRLSRRAAGEHHRRARGPLFEQCVTGRVEPGLVLRSQLDDLQPLERRDQLAQLGFDDHETAVHCRSRSAAISVAVRCQFSGTIRVPARALPRPNSAHSARFRANTAHTSPSPRPDPTRARARHRARCSTSSHDSTRSSEVTAGVDGSGGDSSRSGWSSPMAGDATSGTPSMSPPSAHPATLTGHGKP